MSPKVQASARGHVGRDHPSNAPYGARCFLTGRETVTLTRRTIPGLNAPYGARCFLTIVDEIDAYDHDPES